MKSLNEKILENLEAEVMYCIQKENKDRLSYLYREIEKTKKEIEKEKKMTDRELLELAAKAAGIKIDKSEFNGGGRGNTGFDSSGNLVLNWHDGTTWNPLTDDGDAFRLQVQLKMDVTIGSSVKAVCVNDHIEGGFARVVLEIANDQYEVARRAIVMAAAEIGKAMS